MRKKEKTVLIEQEILPNAILVKIKRVKPKRKRKDEKNKTNRR